MLLANWIDPTMIATTLAARNNVLTRVSTLVRSDPCSPPFALRGSERCRPFGSWPAAWAARRAAAMKFDFPPAVAICGRTPPSAASEAAIRMPGDWANPGRPEPGSSGTSTGKSELDGAEAGGRNPELGKSTDKGDAGWGAFTGTDIANSELGSGRGAISGAMVMSCVAALSGNCVS